QRASHAPSGPQISLMGGGVNCSLPGQKGQAPTAFALVFLKPTTTQLPNRGSRRNSPILVTVTHAPFHVKEISFDRSRPAMVKIWLVAIKIYNSFSGKREDFVPVKSGEARLYVCGITAYDHSHIG